MIIYNYIIRKIKLIIHIFNDFSGNIRGISHVQCNLRYRESYKVFHNFSRYDAHLIVSELTTCIRGKLDVIRQNMENYISITKNVENTDIQFVFIDSYRFINVSLDKMGHNLKIVRRKF